MKYSRRQICSLHIGASKAPEFKSCLKNLTLAWPQKVQLYATNANAPQDWISCSCTTDIKQLAYSVH